MWLMAINSFSSPWIPKAPEAVGAPVSQQTLFGQHFCPTIESNKYLFIDNCMPGTVMHNGGTGANKKY